MEPLLLALLCAVLFGELFFSACQLSQTADEPTHLYSGFRYLKCGDLSVSPEHPPLAKAVAAAPLLLMNSSVTCAPFTGDNVAQAIASLQWLYSQDWRIALIRARLAVSLFAIGLCLLVWMAARRMFDLATAIMATMLLVFEPSLLAYGAQVMTDVPVVCMMLFAVFAFYLWVTKRTLALLLLTALATGLTLLAKHSGVVVVPILCALAVADALRPPVNRQLALGTMFRNLLVVALICAIALGVVWLGYGLRFAAYPGSVQFPNAQPVAASHAEQALLLMRNYRLLPEAYLQGFAGALSIANHSGPIFVAGRIYPSAPWFAVPFQISIRNTAALLMLSLVAVFGIVAIFRRRPRESIFLLIPAGIFLAVCLRSSIIGGVRYLLPAYPFLLIAIAAGCIELARRVAWIRYAVACLILLHAVSSLRASPNYLSYANELWGGSANAYKYLTSLDIGQAYPEAGAYLKSHAAGNCWFVTGWHWDPRIYGVPCQTYGLYLPYQVPPRIHGTMIVSSSLLTDVRLAEGELGAPFKGIEPIGKIGGSALLVYEGDFDTHLAAAMSERLQATLAFSQGQTAAALVHEKRSAELAPESPHAHNSYCTLLAATGQLESAFDECDRAQTLLLQDPLRDDPLRKMFLESIDAQLAQLKAQIHAAHSAAIVPSAARANSR